MNLPNDIQPEKEQRSVPDMKHQAAPQNPTAPSSSGNMQLPSSPHWIMLCLARESPFVSLHQVWFDTTPSNAHLFEWLSKEYEYQREPYCFLTINIPPFWRYIKAVHFVRFRTLGPRPVMTVQIEEMHSFPDYQRQGWVWNGKNGIQGNMIAAYLEMPESAGEGWCVYDYIPKSVSPLPPQDGLEGWGLYLEEGVSRRGKLVLVLVFWAAVYLVRYSMGGEDKTLGMTMTIAGMNVTYVAGIVTAIFVLY